MQSRAFRVGLTGGVAAGKSTAAKFFGALGVPVIDTDQVARKAEQLAQPPLERLVRRFGRSILTTDGRLDPPALRAIVCSDPKARADFEILRHPAVGAAVEASSAEAGGPYQIFVVRRLIENNLGSQMDRVLVVDCDEEIQLSRLRTRDGFTTEQARAMLSATQVSRSARLKAAHDVILNEGDMNTVRDQVEARHTVYLKLARQA